MPLILDVPFTKLPSRILIEVQRLIFRITFYVSYLISAKEPKFWLIGVAENAGVLKNYGDNIPNSKTICFFHDKYSYDLSVYDVVLKHQENNIFHRIKLFFFGPYTLGKLLPNTEGIIYLGSLGFLSNRDERKFEFQFLKKQNKKIVCLFMGSDIRSLQKSQELDEIENTRGMAQYIRYSKADIINYEEIIKLRCYIAEQYANLILNYEKDQISYFKRKTYQWPILYPIDKFYMNLEKFDLHEKIKIVHSPSNPLIKGTPLVHEAIDRLRLENYEFEYIELNQIPNEIVTQELRRAHIVLGQFYSRLPGINGVEALASSCVLLTSASEFSENLAPGANEAWVVTDYLSIYQNLKILLDEPSKLRQQAINGYNYALKNFSDVANQSKLLTLLNSMH